MIDTLDLLPSDFESDERISDRCGNGAFSNFSAGPNEGGLLAVADASLIYNLCFSGTTALFMASLPFSIHTAVSSKFRARAYAIAGGVLGATDASASASVWISDDNGLSQYRSYSCDVFSIYLWIDSCLEYSNRSDFSEIEGFSVGGDERNIEIRYRTSSYALSIINLGGASANSSMIFNKNTLRSFRN